MIFCLLQILLIKMFMGARSHTHTQSLDVNHINSQRSRTFAWHSFSPHISLYYMRLNGYYYTFEINKSIGNGYYYILAALGQLLHIFMFRYVFLTGLQSDSFCILHYLRARRNILHSGSGWWRRLREMGAFQHAARSRGIVYERVNRELCWLLLIHF